MFQKSWLYIKNPQESALLVSITFYTVLYLNRFLLLHVHFQYFTESGSQVAGEAQCSFGEQLLTLLSLCEGAPSPSQHFHWGLLASPAFPGNVSQACQRRRKIWTEEQRELPALRAGALRSLSSFVLALKRFLCILSIAQKMPLIPSAMSLFPCFVWLPHQHPQVFRRWR